MTPPRRLVTALSLLAVTLAMLAPVATYAAAQSPYSLPCATEPCAPRVTGTLANVTYVAAVIQGGADPDAATPVADAGENVTLLVRLTRAAAPANATANETAPANVTVSLGQGIPTLVLSGARTATGTLAPGASRDFTFAFAVPEDAPGTLVRIPFTLTVGEGTASNAVTLEIVPIPAPPAGVSPLVWVAVGAGALVVAGGAYAVARARRPKVQPKSATLQRIEMERKMEEAKTVEEKVAIQEEIKAVEAEKSKARDMQILEAKRADVEKMIDLLKKRHDSGQLTRLQFEKMVEKKLDELDRINAELAEMERAQSGA